MKETKRMKSVESIPNKILTREQIGSFVSEAKARGATIAFTNGCFDILHEGHIFSLSQAAKEAEILIVGVNSDESVKRLKGKTRPVNNQHSRSLILASLLMIDAVVIFEEDTPLELIKTVQPDVLIKG